MGNFLFFLGLFSRLDSSPVCRLGFLPPSISRGGMCTQLHSHIPHVSSGWSVKIICALEIVSRFFLSSSSASETWAPLPSTNSCCLSTLFFIFLSSVASGHRSNTEDSSALVMCHPSSIFFPLNYNVHIFWLLFFYFSHYRLRLENHTRSMH